MTSKLKLLKGHTFENTVPFSMNFCFFSSSELQGEVEPTQQIAAGKKKEEAAFQNKMIYFVVHADLPEVGDLQRSSEVLEPSLESQIAVRATETNEKSDMPTLEIIPTAHVAIKAQVLQQRQE